LAFVETARLDWCGFFRYSEEAGTYAYDLERKVERTLVDERLAELTELQDEITAEKRDELLSRGVRVLVDQPGIARSHREAPEIDGVVNVPTPLEVGRFHDVKITAAEGPDLFAEDA
jgi:ribosomal protein S12 methylthiotransferase